MTDDYRANGAGLESCESFCIAGSQKISRTLGAALRRVMPSLPRRSLMLSKSVVSFSGLHFIFNYCRQQLTIITSFFSPTF